MPRAIVEITMTTKMAANKTNKIASTDLSQGDVFWFSGYWCTFTRFVGERVYARFPYTPEGRDVHMLSHASGEWLRKYGPHMLAIKHGITI